MITLHNKDCLEAMLEMADNQFDLAIVDPPYGLKKSSVQGQGKMKKRIFNLGDVFKWDIAPTQQYFDELMRVSKNQIIWGGNYFDLPPTRCIICWDKKQPWPNFSQIEMAWTSFDTPAKIFRFNNKTRDKIHPTQKPVALYKWLLQNYAKDGDSILDTHLGSGSIAIACHDMGFDLTAYEIDEEYFAAAQQRLKKHQQQLKLF
jgi:site-specific DNA-methyltransferase (adenine-specific)